MTRGQTRKLAAVLAADIAGYSALMSEDENRTVRDLKAHQAIVLPMIGEFGGRIIDTAGDGILAEFASVVNAVECAIAMQARMAERNEPVEPRRRMRFRIGINLGDVIFDEARIYGDGINIAARLEAIAEPGGIRISGKVHDEINGRISIGCDDLGERQLKNISRPVRVYRLRIPGAVTDEAPAKALSAASGTAPPLRSRMEAKSDQDADRLSQRLRFVTTYVIAPVVTILLAHYIILVKLDLADVFLRVFSLLLSISVGFVLFRQTGYGLPVALLVGASIGLASVLGMLTVIAMIDARSIVPSSSFEWQEAAEYAIGIALATVAGSALARAGGSLLSSVRRC